MNPDPKEEFQALVNQAFVQRYLPGRDPLGRSIMLHPQENGTAMKIVGVVANAREEGYAAEMEPIVYSCGFLRWFPDAHFLIRTERTPVTLAHAVRESIHEIDPGRAVYSLLPLSDALSETLSQQRFRAMLVSAFSAIALTLAAIGLYGVMTYMVAQRTREFGVRIALGASPAQIAREIARSAGMLIVAGGAIGILLAVLVSKLLGSQFAGIHTSDPTAYLTAAGVLIGAAIVACLVPGRRATSLSPTEALREQ